MNTSNRFDLETIARQRQMEVEKNVRGIWRQVNGSQRICAVTKVRATIISVIAAFGVARKRRHLRVRSGNILSSH
jgi:ABC-type spermidine/putrescine transport system permease subunit II